jgi:hypothetical protein
MMGHARPPVNKREKTRADARLGGAGRAPGGRRGAGYTGSAGPPPMPCRALHPVFTRDVNCVHADVPPPARAGSGTLLDNHCR